MLLCKVGPAVNPTLRTTLKWVAATLAVLAAFSWLGSGVMRLLDPDYERFESIEVGMKEDEVRQLLGPPTREYSASDAPEDYYVPGFSFKRRPISGRVLIYVGVEPIAYIYLDKEGRVEDTFIGGS
jgi:outer membrane protein assembly factor BamE (lipoprotein component of BamABCDE complex)